MLVTSHKEYRGAEATTAPYSSNLKTETLLDSKLGELRKNCHVPLLHDSGINYSKPCDQVNVKPRKKPTTLPNSS
jgi:hypothetical protein